MKQEEIDLEKLQVNLDGQTLAQLKEIDVLNSESVKSLAQLKGKAMAVYTLPDQMGLPVIPNEEKYDGAWKQIVNEPGPLVFTKEQNQLQLQQIESSQEERALAIPGDKQLMIPNNPE